MTQPIRKQLSRFLIVGLTTVGIDFVVYSALLLAGVEVSVAKATGFVAGMVFAWFANQRFTFSQQGGFARAPVFLALYLATLILNVVANRLCLSAFGSSPAAYGAAWTIATGLSAATNFLGMKFFVFRAAR